MILHFYIARHTGYGVCSCSNTKAICPSDTKRQLGRLQRELDMRSERDIDTI